MKYQTIPMKQFFSCERCNLLCSHSNGDIFTCENTMLLSRVKIPCFRAKAHLVFHWCLYSKIYYYCYTAYCIVLLFLFIYFKIICCSSEYKTLIVTRITTSLWGGGGKGAIKINYTILLYCTNNSFSISF